MYFVNKTTAVAKRVFLHWTTFYSHFISSLLLLKKCLFFNFLPVYFSDRTLKCVFFLVSGMLHGLYNVLHKAVTHLPTIGCVSMSLCIKETLGNMMFSVVHRD